MENNHRLTKQEEREMAALILSAHRENPMADTVPAVIYQALMDHCERLDSECADLHRQYKRLEESTSYSYAFSVERNLKRELELTKRLTWALGASCAILAAAVLGLLLSR